MITIVMSLPFIIASAASFAVGVFDIHASQKPHKACYYYVHVHLIMSRKDDPQLKHRAETLAAILTAEHHPQVASEKLSQTLRELGEKSTQEQVINFRLPRQNSRTAVHLAASKGLWQCLEILLKTGGKAKCI